MTSRTDVASIIDHTLLKPEATPEQFRALVNETAELGTYSVCVSPSALPIEVPDSLHIATVVGFPSGAVKPEIKAAEAARAVADGAEEVDMVINIPLAIEGRAEDLQAEIQAVRDAIPGKVLKVIIESAALTDEEIVSTCRAAEAAGLTVARRDQDEEPDAEVNVLVAEDSAELGLWYRLAPVAFFFSSRVSFSVV